MPIYEYKCENGHVFDAMQRMSDDPLSECQVCGASVKRVFHPVAVHFKGSGFYNTDYGTRKRSREAKETAGSSDGASSDGAEKKSDTKVSSQTKKAESSAASASSSSKSD